MLESGFDVNGSNNSKETVLMVCIQSVKDSSRRIDILKTILKFHPNINLQDCSGKTAFIHACINEQEKTLHFLFQQATLDVNISDEDGYTGFMYVCEKGRKTLVKMLVDAHIKRQICLDFSKVNNHGKTASQIASEKEFLSILPVLNTLESHSNYTKPVLCVPHDNTDQVSSTTTYKTSNSTKNRKKLDLSEIRRALHEAYLSDDENEDKTVKDKHGMSDLVNAVRECATDIRQIYHDQETNDELTKMQMSKAKANKNKTNKTNYHGLDCKDPGTRSKRHDEKRIRARDGRRTKQVSFEEPPIRIIRPIRVQDDTAKGIHIEGLKLTTNGSVGGRRIVLSDTSNYDKNLAVKHKTQPPEDDHTHRRVRGGSTSLPLSIIGKPNKLATKLPYRKVWTSLEQGQFDLERPTSPPGPSLKLPPLKECFQTRGHKENAVKNIDKDMWKILQSYKG